MGYISVSVDLVTSSYFKAVSTHVHSLPIEAFLVTSVQEINILFFSIGFLMVMKLSFSGLGEGLMARPRGLMVTVFTGDPELAMLEIMVTGARIPDTGELVRLRGVRQPSEFRLLI